jgi:hypothetical protein
VAASQNGLNFVSYRFANPELEPERRRHVGDRQDQPTFDCRIAVDRELQKLNLGKNDRVAVYGAELTQVFCDAEPEIRMDVEPVKDRQRFALALADFLDLAPFSSDGVDFVVNETGNVAAWINAVGALQGTPLIDDDVLPELEL